MEVVEFEGDDESGKSHQIRGVRSGTHRYQGRPAFSCHETYKTFNGPLQGTEDLTAQVGTGLRKVDSNQQKSSGQEAHVQNGCCVGGAFVLPDTEEFVESHGNEREDHQARHIRELPRPHIAIEVLEQVVIEEPQTEHAHDDGVAKAIPGSGFGTFIHPPLHTGMW